MTAPAGEVSLKWVLHLRSGTSCDEFRADDGEFPLMGASGEIGRSRRANAPAKSVVIGRVGTVGAVHFARTACWASDNSIIAVAGPDLAPEYMYYGLLAARLPDLASRTAQPLLTASAVGGRRLWVPPLDEQRRIAAFLDAETEVIDRVIRKRERQLDLLRQKRFSAVRDVLRRGLRGAPTKPTSLGWLPEIPADWRLVPLRYLTECLDGRRIPLSAEERSKRQGPYPYYGASRVVDHVDGFLFDEPLVLLGEDGAQLANPTAEVAFHVEGKIWVNNHAHVLRSTGMKGRLLAEVLNVFDRNLCMSGATREKITQEEMNAVLVPLPPDDQQQELIDRIAREHADRAGLESALRKQVRLLVERRQALVAAAVSGRFDVSTAGGRGVSAHMDGVQ
ncbi:restriction endonuclease subunit S [Streptomyces sp. NPDC052114]|uniref:restriction endonuclease subunit S n=1 Tax=unclassified Streptomyces TaxID=2593676 RepID=UPI00341A38D4